MKVKTRTTSEDYYHSLDIEIEALGQVHCLGFHDGEPEDNNLCRNFNDAFQISEMLKLAHAAGKAGEPWEEI